jgi:ATP-binding cassette subfamily B (MDR/TAP) protein 1
VDPDVERAHREATERGASTYTDPASGYEVFTAAALAERGTCCGSGCRHCPYGTATAAG